MCRRVCGGTACSELGADTASQLVSSKCSRSGDCYPTFTALEDLAGHLILFTNCTNICAAQCTDVTFFVDVTSTVTDVRLLVSIITNIWLGSENLKAVCQIQANPAHQHQICRAC